MSTILIITDAWNQMNGVVTTLANTKRVLEAQGHIVKMITPEDFKSVPLPTYSEIKLSINPWTIGKLIEAANADYIHIATEGSIGLFGALYCNRKNYKYTTSYHTKMPEYLVERFPWFSLDWGYAYMRFLHKKSSKVLVTTESMKEELQSHGFMNDIVVWGRGVDSSVFHAGHRVARHKPILLYVGRVSVEKNLESFLDIHGDCQKIVVGDGPQLEELKRKYFDVDFVGRKSGDALAEYYRQADVFKV
jgi:glycosyltransferase involved in cell wall biosynthesis